MGEIFWVVRQGEAVCEFPSYCIPILSAHLQPTFQEVFRYFISVVRHRRTYKVSVTMVRRAPIIFNFSQLLRVCYVVLVTIIIETLKNEQSYFISARRTNKSLYHQNNFGKKRYHRRKAHLTFRRRHETNEIFVQWSRASLTSASLGVQGFR